MRVSIKNKKGYTLVETILAIGVLSVALVSIVGSAAYLIKTLQTQSSYKDLPYITSSVDCFLTESGKREGFYDYIDGVFLPHKGDLLHSNPGIYVVGFSRNDMDLNAVEVAIYKQNNHILDLVYSYVCIVL